MTTSDKPEQRIEHYRDIGYSVVYFGLEDYSVFFAAYRIVGCSDGEDTGLLWDGIDCSPTGDMTEAEVYLEGNVKWDGCSNLTTPGACSLHFCSEKDVTNFTEAILRIWKTAKAHHQQRGSAEFKD